MTGSPPVVIIGAGVGGLTLALLLRRHGIDAELLEQSAELREIGAAVGLAANGTRVLRDLGLGEGLASVGTEPTALIHRDGRDGRMAVVPLKRQWYRDSFGAPFYGIHRAAFQQLLAGAVGQTHLHLGCQAVALAEHGDGMRAGAGSGPARYSLPPRRHRSRCTCPTGQARKAATPTFTAFPSACPGSTATTCSPPQRASYRALRGGVFRITLIKQVRLARELGSACAVGLEAGIWHEAGLYAESRDADVVIQ